MVSLIWFCEEGNEMCLVYDYMERDIIREHLYKIKSNLLWKKKIGDLHWSWSIVCLIYSNILNYQIMKNI